MSLRPILIEPQLPQLAGGPAVHDGASLDGDDERRADSVRQSLRASGYTVLDAVGVTARAGTVTLRGTVPRYFMK
jgi:hypothetical protein